ncbi:hypothetical protein Pelsub_P1966 [Pelolinea submarina]|uniref:Putative ATP-dependent endonuclease of OLD family n=2 Tax=Pelolinea submarina TaxID=913107 RepID=A0A347ZTV6_9CHLR|nr:putative ATP-dependent endonuclease of OLD family [Pelolinea submarina]BBB48737.1 hypothetical protein Pelsub_P1966 [Pelolinea submarina]
MRLFSFQIRNFRSIVDTGECKLSEVDNIVVLAGQNESGKTAILEALDYFRNGPSEKFLKFQMRIGSAFTEVICKFTLENNDAKLLGKSENEYKDIVDKLIGLKISFIRRYEKNPTTSITATEETNEIINNVLQEEFEFLCDENGDKKPVERQEQESNLSEEDSSLKLEKLRNQIIENIIKLIPAFSLYSDFSDLLPSEISVTNLNNNNAVKDFQKVFSVDLLELSKISDPRNRSIRIREVEEVASDDFNRSWSQTISSLKKEEKKYSYSLEIENGEPKKIIFMIVGNDGNPLYLEQKSLGFRWFSAFHLRLRALMEEEKQEEKNGFILLIDEPAQNLHEIAQKDVKRILEETSKTGIQIIYSTHNPNLIGIENNELTRIRLISNEEKTGTKIENITQYISRKNRGNMETLSPIRVAMGLINIHSIFDSNQYNIVVEGITDHYYLSAFREMLQKDERLKFIPACGVENVVHLVSVLLGWGCNYKAVFDDDPQQGRKVYNDLKKYFYEENDQIAHKNIYKIKNANGIEDVFSKEDFKKLVILRDRKNSEKQKENSIIVKESGKEMYARLFLEKVEKGEITRDSFSDETIEKVEEIFSWLYSEFLVD